MSTCPWPLRARGRGGHLAEAPAESRLVSTSVQRTQEGLSWTPWWAAMTLSAKAEPRGGLK